MMQLLFLIFIKSIYLLLYLHSGYSLEYFEV
jgi:hypothetical protein